MNEDLDEITLILLSKEFMITNEKLIEVGLKAFGPIMNNFQYLIISKEKKLKLLH